MRTTLTLADLTARTGLEVLGHLEREVTIPVTGGIQAQGDLLVIPILLLAAETRDSARRTVSIADSVRWHEVPGTGIEVLRAGTGGNPAHLGRRPRHLPLDHERPRSGTARPRRPHRDGGRLPDPLGARWQRHRLWHLRDPPPA